jgi:coproporphyrinogen III oxidase
LQTDNVNNITATPLNNAQPWRFFNWISQYFYMRARKLKAQKPSIFFRSEDLTRIEKAFVLTMIKATPVTTERIAIVKRKAQLSNNARSAKFLDAYRAKVAA